MSSYKQKKVFVEEVEKVAGLRDTYNPTLKITKYIQTERINILHSQWKER